MKTASGFTLIDLATAASILIAGGAIAQITAFTPAPALRAQSLAKMQQHAVAMGQYRLDNAGYLPITMTYTRGPGPGPTSGGLVGWCNWSHAGKNNNAWWATSGVTSGFDVEAADRPLNHYLYPGVTFFAPPPPAKLPASDPARTTAQASLNRDPADAWSMERQWPRVTKGISEYDDVGTSYHWQAEWWDQISRFVTAQFEQTMVEGARRMATGQGVTPSRFVWEEDPFVAITVNASSTATVRNWYGDFNKSLMLFMDGHTGYHTTNPGRRAISYANPDYSLIFDDLPNPGF